MHSGAVQPSVFLNTVIPLSISFPHSPLLFLTAHIALLFYFFVVVFFRLIFLGCFSVVSLVVATHCMALCAVRHTGLML